MTAHAKGRGQQPRPSRNPSISAASVTETPRADTTERWWDTVDWWTDPRLAYAMGLRDGYAHGRAERDADADVVHRDAVHRLVRDLELRAQRRAAA